MKGARLRVNQPAGDGFNRCRKAGVGRWHYESQLHFE
jgi:hypothetical protein